MSYSTCNFLFILSITAIAVKTCPTQVHAKTKDIANIHVYMHDKMSNPNASAVSVVNGSNPIPNVPNLKFGEMHVFDDLCTQGPTPNSTLVGRGQGFYTSMALNKPTFMFVMNVVLTAGEYNGSSIAIMGSDDITLAVRELSVVGGTGQFRMARGYVIVKTFMVNFTNGDAILELDIYAARAKNVKKAK